VKELPKSKKTYSFKVDKETPYLELLAEKTPFSKMALKRLFASGAIWINEGKNDRRVRKVKGTLKAGQKIKVYFDPNIKKVDMDTLKCMHDTHNWGVWYKPAGLLCQGTKYGDEFTLLRHVEKRLNRMPYLVHRLDRETSGLIIMAYDRKSARFFSEQIRERQIQKFYQAELKGQLESDSGEINSPIEGKEAITKYKVLKRTEDSTFIEAEIITGRKHQIRIHFNELGHPVLGDPLYGEENPHKEGLRLVASRLKMREPSRKHWMKVKLDSQDLLIDIQ
jgi:tRNA pseudouridine32 synthase/23S rRNA pseudouridine746 synthase